MHDALAARRARTPPDSISPTVLSSTVLSSTVVVSSYMSAAPALALGTSFVVYA
jgi:hypothetical protein